MDIYFYVKDSDGEEHVVGRALIPVVPRVGETVWLRMSLTSQTWSLDPETKPARYDTAYFQVDAVCYDAWNVEDTEPGMGAAPYAEGSTSHMVTCYVHAANENTQVYVDRVIAKSKAESV